MYCHTWYQGTGTGTGNTHIHKRNTMKTLIKERALIDGGTVYDMRIAEGDYHIEVQCVDAAAAIRLQKALMELTTAITL